MESSHFFSISKIYAVPKITHMYTLGVESSCFYFCKRKWKDRVSSYFSNISMTKSHTSEKLTFLSNILQCHESHMYILVPGTVVESSRFFLFLQYITLPKLRTCKSWEWKARISFLFLKYMQCKKSHKCTPWEWKARVFISAIYYSAKIAYMLILGVDGSNFFLQYIIYSA